MTITLRPWDLERDAVRMTEVLNRYGPETITLEGVLDGERRFPKEGLRRRMVATDAADRLVGWSVVVRGPWAPPGRFFVNVKVDPAFCRQGIGSRLCAEAMAFAREQGATELKSEVPEGYEAFALRYGFQIDRHVFESILNVGSFDETPYAGLIETVEASGIRFTSMAEFGADEGARRKLWELELTVARDDPSNTGFNIETPFEDYCREVFSARWYRADTQLLALDGDRFVGMAALAWFEDSHTLYHNLTGVLREYRGRHIAQALKLLAVQAARRYGAVRLRTNNDSQNAPMLAINRKMGYVPQAGKYLITNGHPQA